MTELGGANRDILKRQLQILRKAPEQRSPEDVRAFAASLSKTKFFQDLGEHEKIQVCRYLKLEGAPRDTTLFKQGDRGDKFYLILCGSVGIFIKEVEAKDVEASKAEPSAEGAGARPPSPGPAVSPPSSPTPQGEPEVAAPKEQSVGWVKLAKLVHGAVPPTVAELQLEGALIEPPEVPPPSVPAAEALAPPADAVPVEEVELPVDGKASPHLQPPSPKQLTIAEGEAQGTPRSGPSEAFKLQMQRSESRLSAKSVGSEHSDGAADGRSPSPALVREPSLLSEIKSIGAFAKKEKEEADSKRATGAGTGKIMRAILARPLFHLRGPKLIEVAQLQVGDSFGEVALQTDQPRAATVKTRSDAIFATLVREDYKAILHSQLSKLQQDRQSFLRSIPLLEALPNIPNLAALLQSRTFCRHGILINVGTPVMHIYLVSSGTFSIRGRIKVKPPKDRPSKTARPTEDPRRRPSDLNHQEKEKAAKSEKIPVSRTILSLVLPGTTYGLSHFLKGDREHLRQVICESSSGVVYTLFAKDVAAHLNQKERSEVIAIAAAEEAFFKQRCMAVGQLHGANSKAVKRVWPPEKTLLDKIREFRDVFSAKSIYSPEGRLRAIGSAFLEESKHLETQLHLEKVQAAKQSVHSTGEEKAMASVADAAGAPLEPVLASGWRMQYLAKNVFRACHDTSNPGALAADLRAALEKDIRLARRSKRQLVPISRRPWNPLEDVPATLAETPQNTTKENLVPVQQSRASQRPDPYISQLLGSGLSVVRSEESLELTVESPAETTMQLGHLEQLGLSTNSTVEVEAVEADCSKCSKSVESMGTDEECSSTLPCDFFSSRLLDLSPGSFRPHLSGSLALPMAVVPTSRCSTGLPQSRGSRGTSMGSRDLESSPWPVQLDQVFIAKGSNGSKSSRPSSQSLSWRANF
eukprot:s168_g5.t1